MKALFSCNNRLPISRPASITPSGFADSHSGRSDKECVVLLHGLTRTHRSLKKMAAALEEAGYHTINMGYPSRKFAVEHLAMQLIPESLRRCGATPCDAIHFVTHSMGGILLRYYLSQRPIEAIGRVVMLSPPNHGSEAIDALRGNRLFHWINGPAGQQLGTGPDGITADLGAVQCPVGVITGNVHAFFDAFLSRRIPGEHDGKVSVQSARLDGMNDFLVLPYPHGCIMNKALAIAQTLHFLREGAFMRPTTTDAPPSTGSFHRN